MSERVSRQGWSWMRALRWVSMTEGVSFLLLLLVAMPLKYRYGMGMAVTYVGWAHGGLFISLGLLGLRAWLVDRLPFRVALGVGIASLLPGGPFWMDRFLRKHELALESPGFDASSSADV